MGNVHKHPPHRMPHLRGGHYSSLFSRASRLRGELHAHRPLGTEAHLEEQRRCHYRLWPRRTPWQATSAYDSPVPAKSIRELPSRDSRKVAKQIPRVHRLGEAPAKVLALS